MGGTTIAIPSDLQRLVENYRISHDFESFADAARALIRAGLKAEEAKKK